MSYGELESLAAEVRDLIIKTVSQQGGHLSSSLGAVELAVAINAAYESPRDKIVWDVGHQAYAHKILTGRASRFATLRQRAAYRDSRMPKKATTILLLWVTPALRSHPRSGLRKQGSLRVRATTS